MTIIAPQRHDPITDSDGVPSLRFSDVIEELVETTNALVANTDEYTTEFVVESRNLNANQAAGDISVTYDQAEIENLRDSILVLADVVGTLVEDLQAAGVIQ